MVSLCSFTGPLAVQSLPSSPASHGASCSPCCTHNLASLFLHLPCFLLPVYMLLPWPGKRSPSLHPGDTYPFFSPQLRNHFPISPAESQISVAYSDSTRYISFTTSITAIVMHLFVWLFNGCLFSPRNGQRHDSRVWCGTRRPSNEKASMIYCEFAI